MGGKGSGRHAPAEPTKRDIKITFDYDEIRKVNPKQALAFRCAMSNEFDEMLVGGAYRGGKSYLLALVTVAKALTIPGGTCIITSFLLDQLKDQVWPIIMAALPEDAIESHRESPRPRAVLKNGSRIIGIPASRVENFRGHNDVVFIGADEANLIPEACFPEMRSRFSRPMGAEYKPLLFCTSNPSAGYIKKHFITHVEHPDTTIFIPFTAFDNTALDPDYIERQKRNLGEGSRAYRRYILGDWNTFEGQVFEQFDPSIHTGEFEFDPRRRYTKVCGMDYGWRNPTVIAYMAMDSDGFVYIYDEVCGSKLLPGDISKLHREKCREHGLTDEESTLVADPSVWQADKSTGESPASVMMNLPGDQALVLDKADNDYQGIICLQSLIAQNKLLIHSSACPEIIQAFMEFRFKPETNEMQRKGAISEDFDSHRKDYIDGPRYGLNRLIPPGSRDVSVSVPRSERVQGIEIGEDDGYSQVERWDDALYPTW